MGGFITRLLGKEDVAAVLLELDQQIAATQHRLALYEKSRTLALRRVIYLTLFSLILYAIYWKFFLTPLLSGLHKFLYIAAFAVIPAAGWLLAKVVNSVYLARIRSNETRLDSLRHDQAFKLEELKRRLNWDDTERLINRIQMRLVTSGPPTPERSELRSPGVTSPSGRPQPQVQPQQTPYQQMTRPAQQVQPTPSRSLVTPAKPTPAASEAPSTVKATRTQGGQAELNDLVEPDRRAGAVQAQPAPSQPPAPVIHAPRTMPVPQHMRTEIVQQEPAPAASGQPPVGWIDKLVDFLIGESPTNSFALICEKCHKNNGLAPKDEMDGIEFVCAACGHFNRRMKTTSERIASSPSRLSQRSESSSSNQTDSDLRRRRPAEVEEDRPAPAEAESKKDQ